MGKSTCTLNDCTGSLVARGWCMKHYQRWKRHGDPAHIELSRRPSTVVANVEERFWSKVDKNGPVPQFNPALGPCWLWIAGRSGNGYGSFGFQGSVRSAHAVSYCLSVGDIPEGRELDHLCMVKHCVNPAHLEAVPHVVNQRRADAAYGQRSAKTHCPHGHEYSAENTRITKVGRRCCRTCDRANAARYQQRLREART